MGRDFQDTWGHHVSIIPYAKKYLREKISRSSYDIIGIEGDYMVNVARAWGIPVVKDSIPWISLRVVKIDRWAKTRRDFAQ